MVIVAFVYGGLMVECFNPAFAVELRNFTEGVMLYEIMPYNNLLVLGVV